MLFQNAETLKSSPRWLVFFIYFFFCHLPDLSCQGPLLLFLLESYTSLLPLTFRTTQALPLALIEFFSCVLSILACYKIRLRERCEASRFQLIQIFIIFIHYFHAFKMQKLFFYYYYLFNLENSRQLFLVCSR